MSVTAQQVAEIFLNSIAEIEEEDRLFDEYCALPNRPKVKRMMRMTEVDPLEEYEMVDLDDFDKWKQERRNAGA